MYTTSLYNFIYNDPHSQLFYKIQFFTINVQEMYSFIPQFPGNIKINAK